MPARMKFMETEKGQPRLRCELFIMPPRLKLDKEQHRVLVQQFSMKLDATCAIACDEKVQRAFEDCEFLDREIKSVELKCEVENTDLHFFDVEDSKKPCRVVDDLKLVGLYVERSDGTTYLYFQFEAKLAGSNYLGEFFLNRYGTAIYAEFVASRFAHKFDHQEVAPPEKASRKAQSTKDSGNG